MKTDCIRYLEKRRYGNRGGGIKYFVDCSVYRSHPERIQTELLLRNVRKPHDISIIRAVATDDTIQKKNKRIVVKIFPNRRGSNQEYDIGEFLHQEHLPGFVRYLCQFSCFDDTVNTATTVTESQPSQTFSAPICQGTATQENKKVVLVMPFIPNGSIEKHVWCEDNLPLLKNLLVHTVLSLAMAFDRVGFVHGDLHAGNILFKPTQQREITYSFAHTTFTLGTMGYKIVLVDFEKAKLRDPSVSILSYWNNLLFMCKHVETALLYYDDYYISWENTAILGFLRKTPPALDALPQFLDLMQTSQFTFHAKETHAYNPDV